MTDVRLKISPPWITYVNMLQAIFDEDPQIAFNTNLGNGTYEVTLATNNSEKAAALRWLLPEEKTFGNITLTIGIDSGDKVINKAFGTAKELFETAFYKNPVLAYVVVPDTSLWVPFTYVVFKNCVVQFFNDNLNDPHGVISTLYQDIASEIFADMSFPQDGGICYCTDVEHKLGAPLGEWP